MDVYFLCVFEIGEDLICAISYYRALPERARYWDRLLYRVIGVSFPELHTKWSSQLMIPSL